MNFKCGHEMTPENTYERSNGWTECRACRKQRSWDAWKRRQKPQPELRTLLFDRVSIGGFDACWWWKGNVNVHGYGTMKVNQRQKLAHRLVYEWLHGPIPKGRLLHHTCVEPLCVNPKHLVPVTHQEHQDAHVALRTEA